MAVQGYRLVIGTDPYSHSFGGLSWKTPKCPNCKTNLHLIFNLDLKDPKLEQMNNGHLDSLPLISCLNCSSYWSRQVFEIEPKSRTISIVKQFDEEQWISEEEDRLPYPLPVSSMHLVELTDSDTPTMDDDTETDLAFEAFGSEYVCRVLGEPLFALETIHKTCDSCNKEMEYLATVCSEDYNSEGLVHEDFSFQFGESYIYFHFCKHCNVLETEMQSS